MKTNIKYINKNNKNINKILNNKIYLNKKLYNENIKIKQQIDEIPYEKWKIIRSISSDYEIIGNNKIHQNKKIKEINIISRAYFKLLEILNIYENILNIKSNKKEISIDCLCEAPGGFIKCLYDYRNNENDKYKTISIKNNIDNIINWNIDNIKNLEIIYGNEEKKHDGNICNPEIINYYIKKHKEKVDLVTADGGILLNNNEENYKSNYHIQLFLCELFIAMKILKNDGKFIMKIYELSSKIMIDFMIILNNIFQNVRIFKPKTSREMNNEKYIICNNLNKNLNNISSILWNIIKELWNDKNLLLINILDNIEYKNQKNINLINIFEKNDNFNLCIQNKKLKKAIELKNYDILFLKNTLKNKKPEHFKNAYKWFNLNNIYI